MFITVLMCVYNSAQFLEKAILSILNQTYKEFEFLIVDDGSTDGSIDICKRYAAVDSRIVIIKNERNLGLAASLNKGIEQAKGQYIARQDADDCSLSNRLEIQLNYALENKQIEVIGSDCFVTDIADRIVFLDDSFSKIKEHRHTLLNRKAIFPHGSAFLRKEKLLEAGLYDPRFYYVQDAELWLRLIKHGARIHVINQPLYFYRTGPVATRKRAHAKALFNKVLQMIYAENKDPAFISSELEKIQAYLKNAGSKKHSHYMANYWKSLGNAAYFNKWDIKTALMYISKAVRESNSFINYFKYFILSLIYVFPPGLIKTMLRFRREV